MPIKMDIDIEIVVMVLLLGVLIVITIFRHHLIKLVNLPGNNNINVGINDNDEENKQYVEGFTSITEELQSGDISQVVKNFIRLGAYTRDGQTGMMNTIHLNTRNVVNPDTDVLVNDSIMLSFVNNGYIPNQIALPEAEVANVSVPSPTVIEKTGTQRRNFRREMLRKRIQELRKSRKSRKSRESWDNLSEDTEDEQELIDLLKHEAFSSVVNPIDNELELTKKQKDFLIEIGSKQTGEKRMNDFYLDADNGLNITLDMQYNDIDVPSNSNVLPSILTIREVVSGKQYNMVNPIINYSSVQPHMLMIEGTIMNPESKLDDTVYRVIQKFIIKLYFIRPLDKLLTGINAVNTLKTLINDNLSLAKSTLNYKLLVPLILPIAQPLYDIGYYFRRGEVNLSSIAQVTNNEIIAITDEVLKEKVPNIITPLYVLDHDITKMNDVITAISDEYKNIDMKDRQRELQFYDTYS